MKAEKNSRFVVCMRNEGCDDLDRRKIYRVIQDEAETAEGYLRVVDDSGEDYLYPAEYFIAIELQPEVEEALLLAS